MDPSLNFVEVRTLDYDTEGIITYLAKKRSSIEFVEPSSSIITFNDINSSYNCELPSIMSEEVYKMNGINISDNLILSYYKDRIDHYNLQILSFTLSNSILIQIIIFKFRITEVITRSIPSTHAYQRQT